MPLTISGDTPNFSAATITTGTVTTLTTTTLSDGTNSTSSTNCIRGSAKAWVNINGASGASPTIRASYNVSSVTRTGTGAYTVNFTNAFADANYSYVFGGQPSIDIIAGYKTPHDATNTTTQMFIQTGSAVAVSDFTTVNVSVFR